LIGPGELAATLHAAETRSGSGPELAEPELLQQRTGLVPDLGGLDAANHRPVDDTPSVVIQGNSALS
jgi:hypothetical protein